MRKFSLASILVITTCCISFSCTKKVGTPAKVNTTKEFVTSSCDMLKDTIVSYSKNIQSILRTNCGSCHSKPGSGGINLDSYEDVKSLAISGELLTVITNTDLSSVIMPPPTYRHLDSCEIKALNRWIVEQCPDN